MEAGSSSNGTAMATTVVGGIVTGATSGVTAPTAAIPIGVVGQGGGGAGAGGGGSPGALAPGGIGVAAITACAACKFQRRRCTTDCVLAPYFPTEHTQQFMNCRRLFGVSNMVRMLRDAEPHERDALMRSLIVEADARERYPVLGIVSAIQQHHDEELNRMIAELNRMRAELNRMRAELNRTRPEPDFYHPQQHQHHLQQRQHHQLQQSIFQQTGAEAQQQPMHIGHITLSDPGDHPSSSLPASLQLHPHPQPFVDLRQQLLPRPVSVSASSSGDFNFFENNEPRFSDEAPLVPVHDLRSAAASFRLTSQQQQQQSRQQHIDE